MRSVSRTSFAGRHALLEVVNVLVVHELEVLLGGTRLIGVGVGRRSVCVCVHVWRSGCELLGRGHGFLVGGCVVEREADGMDCVRADARTGQGKSVGAVRAEPCSCALFFAYRR